MGRIIPNENSFIGFATTVASIAAPTAAEVTAAVDLTDYVISISATKTGNTVPTPTLKRRFEPSIPGTITGAFSMDAYRDDADDLAWDTLLEGTEGYMIISRFGGSGTDAAPVAGDSVEVWPIRVTSASNSGMTSNTAETVTFTCAVFEEPDEHATVAA